MATVVQLHQVEVGSKALSSQLWKVEYDHCEGLGTTPRARLKLSEHVIHCLRQTIMRITFFLAAGRERLNSW